MRDEASILAETLTQPAEQRSAFLHHACGEDTELRTRLERCLAQQENTLFSDTELPADKRRTLAASTFAADQKSKSSKILGTTIGRYRLVDKLGEGGMGSVFRADQLEPVQREVALKIIKPEMVSETVVARFQAERQALALMEHQNIARVLDAGETDTGLPYFVMELVKGTPITRYTDDKLLTCEDRLKLFISVCQAIQHAHQKGIIHRDIKPSNVLVALEDGAPAPKVIDFGVAKVIDQGLSDDRQVTQIGSIVGTLDYMSPEQAAMGSLDIDTRSDIYSLGVILFELLTGSTPLGGQRLERSSLNEILRCIRENDPPKPSERLNSSGESKARVSKLRGLDPRKLQVMLRGELDWIVLKCLDTDRERRYQTAAAVALDVQRYLADEPVDAGPPSKSYRLMKVVRKHRGALATCAAFGLLLVVGSVFCVWQAVRATFAEQAARSSEVQANQARDNALHAEARAKKDRDKAFKAEKKATQQKVRALKAEAKTKVERDAALTAKMAAKESEGAMRAFSRFLVWDILSAARPKGEAGGLGINVTVREALHEAAGRIPVRFRGQPRAEAVARHDLGVTFRRIGELIASEKQLRQAHALRRKHLGKEHVDTLHTQNSLAVLLGERGKYKESLNLYQENYQITKALYGLKNPTTVTALGRVAIALKELGEFKKAIPIYEKVLKLQRTDLGENHPETLLTMNNLAMAYKDNGQLDEAVNLFLKTLELQKGRDQSQSLALTTINNLAASFRQAGQTQKALAMLERIVGIANKQLGPDHPNTLVIKNNLAATYKSTRDFDKAIPLYQQTLKGLEIKLGKDHPHTLAAMNNLAVAYQDSGDVKKALPLIAHVYQQFKIKLGPNHPNTRILRKNLANAYRADGQLKKALEVERDKSSEKK